MNATLVLHVIDTLAAALVDLDHYWTPDEQREYEEAVAELKPLVDERRHILFGRCWCDPVYPPGASFHAEGAKR